MNCTEIRQALPDLLYGHENAAQRQAIESHLKTCPDCEAQLTSLQGLKGLLDRLSTPPVKVDVGQILQAAHDRQERRARRWRRAAVALAGVAAVLGITFGLKIELRSDGRELVLRWGESRNKADAELRPAPDTVTKPVEKSIAKAVILPVEVTRADLKLVRDLIHALATDVDNRDHRRQESLAWFQKELDRLDREAQERWAATVRYVNAAPAAENQEGVNP